MRKTEVVSVMAPDRVRTFLAEGTRTAKLATVRAGGRPHVAPVWFVLDGDDLIFTTGERTLKGQALRRDRRMALCVDDERPPFAFVIITGHASVSTDLDEVIRWATRIGARYIGQERGEEFGRRNGVPGELLVRVTPTSVVAEENVAG
jgi:PPOX class probable F420-dependent enzyme